MDKNMKILVVDDFSTMRRIIINFLKQLGFSNFSEADNGSDALAKLKSSTYDLLITDWNMPKMSGLELLKAVRAEPQLVNIPVLMITAEARREQIVAAAQAGVNGYIVKPFNATALQEKLEKIFVRLAA